MWTTTERILRSHRIFATLSDEELSALARAALAEEFSADTTFAREGAPAEHLFVVATGAVELFTDLGGRETSIAVLGPLAVFFVAPVVSNVLNPMSARTIRAARLVKFPAGEIRGLAERDASFARALTVELARRYTELVDSLKSQKLRRSVHRVARYLVSQHEDQGAAGRITLPVRKQTLASLLGITPSALSRAFAALKSYGVTVDGYKVELAKPRDLEDFANDGGERSELRAAH